MLTRTCRGCSAELKDTFCDLGTAPFSNDYLTQDKLRNPELYYPLHAYVCRVCFLVQIEAFETPARHFADYAYFSSYSSTWLDHAKAFADLAISRFGLTPNSLVVELASNDGYLLRWFKERAIPVLGVEPAANVAASAIAAGINTEVRFFGEEAALDLVQRGHAADLVIANNVLAHVPDIHDFVAGIEHLLKENAVASIEFPHLLRLIAENQFDTIYHEHFSYLSILSLEPILRRHGLAIVDVDELPTHGGTLRVYLARTASGRPVSGRVTKIRDAESAAGLGQLSTYHRFDGAVQDRRDDFLAFLANARREGRIVAGYGAPAKGNTFLNYCGLRRGHIAFTADRNPAKQGKFLPGSRIPIFSPDEIDRRKPEYVVIFPWNLREEVATQLAAIRDWGGKFVVAIPELEVF